MANRYYYLKIGKGNKDAESCLSGKAYLKKPCAVIYFGKQKIKDLLKGNGNKQAINFCRESLPEKRKDVFIIIINNGLLWIAQPNSIVKEFPDNGQDIPKVIELKIVKKEIHLSKIPLILASINANRFISSGTFRQIKKRGNIKAIRMVLNKSIPEKYYTEKYAKSKYLLECLSSTELETLIAKIFESRGCFVPAYHGGNMKYIDLVIKNNSSKIIDISGIKIKRNAAISIQVKTQINKKEKYFSDYTISLNDRDAPNHFNADWILQNVRADKNIAKWLKLSLSWLPKDYLKCFNI